MQLPTLFPMRPRYVEKIWGGARVAALPAKKRAGHAPPAGMRIGESWEVADLVEGCSVVDGGPWDKTPLRALVEQHGRALVGERAREGPDGVLRFPLLVKLIDAGDDLSVQVHPGQDYARAHPGTFSKDEAWLVVSVDPGARVLHGFRDGVTKEKFVDAIAHGRAHELLRNVRVSVGDVLRIAPGTVHAVGAGCVLLEVQEPSDTTFRVWDYNRQENGKPRKLHVEQALEVARFGKQDPPLVQDLAPGAGLTTSCYSMHVMHVDSGSASAVIERPRGEPAVLFVLDGTVDVDGAHLPQGATAIVPACAGDVPVSVHGGAGAHDRAVVVVMSTGA